ncbi:MAG: response regulator [Proteobacteria bacterium]|nr:response regulator [Pseudomonadota bacterium]
MIEIDPKMKILIVSGDPEVALSCKLLLKKVGLNQIETIESGIDALRVCQSNKFSIIICNQNSKHLSGWLFIQELKNSPKIANTGVLLMGIAASPAKPEQLARYGVPPYMVVPLSSKTLMSSISSVLGDLATLTSIENRYTVAKDALIAQNGDLAIGKYKELHQLTNKSMRSTIGLIQSHEISESQNEAEAAAYAIDRSTHEDATPGGIMISLRYI